MPPFQFTWNITSPDRSSGPNWYSRTKTFSALMDWMKPSGGIFRRSLVSEHRLPGLVNVNMLPWKDPSLFMGKSTISMAMFNCYVSSPKATKKNSSSITIFRTTVAINGYTGLRHVVPCHAFFIGRLLFSPHLHVWLGHSSAMLRHRRECHSWRLDVQSPGFFSGSTGPDFGGISPYIALI